MPSPEEMAIAGAAEIERRKLSYAAACEAVKQSKDKEDPKEAQIKLVNNRHSEATAFFNFVDQCIANSELLGAHRSEFWATDLAGTAVNVLDNVAKYYASVREDASRLEIKNFEPSPNAFFAMQSSVVIYNPDQVKALKSSFEKLGLPVRGFTHYAKMNTRYHDWEKLAMAATAVIFLLLLLAIGVFLKDYNNFNIFLFRTVLALVGAAFGGIFVSGFVSIEAKGKRWAVCAGGAAAFFVIIFFFNPPELIRHQIETKKVD